MCEFWPEGGRRAPAVVLERGCPEAASLAFQQPAWKQVIHLVISSALRKICKKLLDINTIIWLLASLTMYGMQMFTELFTYSSSHQICEHLGLESVCFFTVPVGCNSKEVFQKGNSLLNVILKY